MNVDNLMPLLSELLRVADGREVNINFGATSDQPPAACAVYIRGDHRDGYTPTVGRGWSPQMEKAMTTAIYDFTHRLPQ